jgi:hypothetical protein
MRAPHPRHVFVSVSKVAYSVPIALYSLSHSFPTPPQLRVPHPRHVFVPVARVGYFVSIAFYSPSQPLPRKQYPNALKALPKAGFPTAPTARRYPSPGHRPGSRTPIEKSRGLKARVIGVNRHQFHFMRPPSLLCAPTRKREPNSPVRCLPSVCPGGRESSESQSGSDSRCSQSAS